MVMPAVDLQELPISPAAHSEPEYETPDPYLRPVQGEVLDEAVWHQMSGIEVLSAQLSGELPPPPLHYLTGMRLVSVEEGNPTFALPASEWLTAPPPGRLQGGTISMLADGALVSAIQATLPAGTFVASVDLKINFLRPAAPDGQDLIGQGTVIHRGRNVAVANAEVTNAEGKVVVTATGSALLLAGRTI
jgi:uncharacterized protein (TIGR00369 family)